MIIISNLMFHFEVEQTKTEDGRQGEGAKNHLMAHDAVDAVDDNEEYDDDDDDDDGEDADDDSGGW